MPSAHQLTRISVCKLRDDVKRMTVLSFENPRPAVPSSSDAAAERIFSSRKDCWCHSLVSSFNWPRFRRFTGRYKLLDYKYLPLIHGGSRRVGSNDEFPLTAFNKQPPVVGERFAKRAQPTSARPLSSARAGGRFAQIFRSRFRLSFHLILFFSPSLDSNDESRLANRVLPMREIPER